MIANANFWKDEWGTKQSAVPVALDALEELPELHVKAINETPKPNLSRRISKPHSSVIHSILSEPHLALGYAKAKGTLDAR